MPDETPPDLGEKFQLLLDDGNVSVLDLLEADIWRSASLHGDSAHLAVGENYYPKLYAACARKHPDAEIIVSGVAGMAIALGANKPDEFEILINRAVIRFDWAKPGLLITRINELAEEVRRWIPDPAERNGLLVTLLGIASQVLVAVARANDSIPVNDGESADPPASLAGDLEPVEPQIDRAREQFLEDAQRAAQLRYAKGMAWGGLGLLVLSVLGGIGFLHWDVRAVNGVGLLAGGIGACVSVLQRMTSGTLTLNFQTVDRMLLAFGALRPFVGGVFGLITFCVLDAGLISAIHLPAGAGESFSFVAVFAFAAGFNERFFQDMLAKASHAGKLDAQSSEGPPS